MVADARRQLGQLRQVLCELWSQENDDSLRALARHIFEARLGILQNLAPLRHEAECGVILRRPA